MLGGLIGLESYVVWAASATARPSAVAATEPPHHQRACYTLLAPFIFRTRFLSPGSLWLSMTQFGPCLCVFVDAPLPACPVPPKACNPFRADGIGSLVRGEVA